MPLEPLDGTFAARAIPTGSARHWSYVFAAPPLRGPLLGIFALSAEWQALLDPATERSVAQLKLAWWYDEMRRLCEGAAVHPISRYLASQPGAAAAHFKMLMAAVDAASRELSGVPLESAAELRPHCSALLAGPLRVASLIAAAPADESALQHSTQALAVAQYLARALRDYRREAAAGRMPFAVDELLQAGVENTDLLATRPAPRLRAYLEGLRRRAETGFASVLRDTPHAARPPLRHLLVLAALGSKYLPVTAGESAVTAPHALAALKDMLLAWRTARGAGS
jgi:phytoene synthase